MRHVLQDSRTIFVENFSQNPTGQAPSGFVSEQTIGGESITTREYVQVSGIPVPVFTGIKHTRNPLTLPTGVIAVVKQVGVYAVPNSGPWRQDVNSRFTDITYSAYVYASRNVLVQLTADFDLSFPNPFSYQSADIAVPANTWTRVSFTFLNGKNNPDGFLQDRAFDPGMVVVPDGGGAASPGDSIIVTGVQFEGGVALTPYFDGNTEGAWWNIGTASADPVTNVGPIYYGPGNCASLRYELAPDVTPTYRSNRVRNPRGLAGGLPQWGFIGGTATATQVTGLTNVPTGVSTAVRRTLLSRIPGTTVAIRSSSGSTPGETIQVDEGQPFTAGVMFWHSNAGSAVAIVTFLNEAGAGVGTITGTTVTQPASGTGSAGAWLTVTGTVPAGAVRAMLHAGWPVDATHNSIQFAGQVLRRNYTVNPRPSAATYWGATPTGWALTFSTSAGPTEAPNLWARATTTAVGANTLNIFGQPGSNIPVTPGQVYSVSAAIFHTNTPTARVTPYVEYYDAGGSFLDSTTPATGAVGANSTWYRRSATFTVPAGAVSMRPGVSIGLVTGWPVGAYAGAGAFLVELASSNGTYFDGATANPTSSQYVWTGTANASASEERANGDWMQSSSMHYEQGSSTPLPANRYFDGDMVSATTEDFSWFGDPNMSSSRALETTGLAVTNLVKNPSFETGTAGWFSANGATTVTRIASTPDMEGAVGQWVSETTTTTSDQFSTTFGDWIPAKANKWYGMAAWVSCDVAAGRLIRWGFQMEGDSTTYPQGSEPSSQAGIPDGGLVVLAVGSAPGLFRLRPRVQLDAGSGNTLAVGARLRSDRWLVVEGDSEADARQKLKRYFDGSMPDASQMTYVWAGDPHASVSRSIEHPAP